MKNTITCTPINAVVVKIGNSRKLYASKKTARRNVAWRLLYDTGRISKDVSGGGEVGWVWSRHECECTELSHPYGGTFSDSVDSSSCTIHNRYNGYYKRLHARIMRWLEKGYIAKDSGLQEFQS